MMSACLELFFFSSFLLASFFSLGLANGLDPLGMALEEFDLECEGGEEVEFEFDSAAELVRRGPLGTEREAD